MSGYMLALLAAYYACDAEATIGRLDPAEIPRCSTIYESVKAGFLDAAEDAGLDADGPGPASTLAFRRFRAWEAANPALVADLRRAAIAGPAL